MKVDATVFSDANGMQSVFVIQSDPFGVRYMYLPGRANQIPLAIISFFTCYGLTGRSSRVMILLMMANYD